MSSMRRWTVCLEQPGLRDSSLGDLTPEEFVAKHEEQEKLTLGLVQ